MDTKACPNIFALGFGRSSATGETGTAKERVGQGVGQGDVALGVFGISKRETSSDGAKDSSCWI